MELFRRIAALRLNYSRKVLYTSLLCAVATGLLPIFSPYLFGRSIDVILAGGGLLQISPILGALLLVIFGNAAVALVAGKTSVQLGYDAAQQISRITYDAILRMPFLTYNTVSQGVVISRLTNDVRMLEPLLVEVPLTAVRGWTSILVTGVALAIANPWFLTAFLVVPLSLFLVRYAEAKIDDTIQQSFESSAKISSLIENTTSADAVSLIRQARRTTHEVEAFDSATQTSARIATKLDFWRSNVRAAYDVSFGIVSVLLLGVGAFVAAHHYSTIGEVISAILYVLLLRQPLSDLIGLRYPVLRGSIGLGRLENVINSPNTGLTTITSQDEHFANRSEIDGPLLEFIDVGFRYPLQEDISVNGLSHVNSATASLGFASGVALTALSDDLPQKREQDAKKSALADVSFTVSRGEIVAIAGASGAGKSTIVALACGLLRPTAGKIKLCDRDTSILAEEQIWRDISLVSQDIFLRDGTLRENLSFGLGYIDDAQLREACDFAGLSSTLQTLPDGLDTTVGHRGRRFSGGERQRVSIARALLKDAKVLILDEATSHLDNATEAEVLATLDIFKKERAVLVVAHRIAAVERSDRVVMLDGGTVVEVGNPRELLATNGYFASLHLSPRQ